MLGNTFSCNSIFISPLYLILLHAFIIGIIFPLLTPLNKIYQHLEHDFFFLHKEFYFELFSLWEIFSHFMFYENFFTLKFCEVNFLNLSKLSTLRVDVSHPNKSEIRGELIEKKILQRWKEKLTKKFCEKICNSRKRLSLYAHNSQRTTAIQHPNTKF